MIENIELFTELLARSSAKSFQKRRVAQVWRELADVIDADGTAEDRRQALNGVLRPQALHLEHHQIFMTLHGDLVSGPHEEGLAGHLRECAERLDPTVSLPSSATVAKVKVVRERTVRRRKRRK